MKATLAPVALFVFNRPEHLRRTIESLRLCEGFADSPVIVFADGIRNTVDSSAVDATRRVAIELLGDKAEYRLAEINQGLGNSIISGVGQLLEQYGRVIVVEDDLVLSPCFLRFMNDGLEHYSNDSRVYQISGHMFDVREFGQRREALLLPLTTTWGWATWDRAWKAFDPNATGWEKLLRDHSMRKRFNLGGVYDYTHMLERQMSGKRQSWGVRWYWSVFARGGLTCFPPQSLVANIGMDGTGTHGCGKLRTFERITLTQSPLKFVAPPGEMPELPAFVALRRAIWHQNGKWLGLIVDLLRRAHWALSWRS